MSDKKKVHELVISFDNKKALKHFKSWLDGQGEQDYWNWMECRESEESGPITAVKFNYHSGDQITTECGRLSQDEFEDD